MSEDVEAAVERAYLRGRADVLNELAQWMYEEVEFRDPDPIAIRDTLDRTARDARRDAGQTSDVTPSEPLDLWGTRTTSSGAFPKAKKSGDVFRGARHDTTEDN